MNKEVEKLELLIMLIKLMEESSNSEELSKAHGYLLAEYYNVIEELETIWSENRMDESSMTKKDQDTLLEYILGDITDLIEKGKDSDIQECRNVLQRIRMSILFGDLSHYEKDED